MKKNYYKLALLVFVAFTVSFFSLKSLGAVSDYQLDREIESLNLKIQLQKKQIQTLQEKQKEYQEQIAAKRSEKVSLNNQLGIIENRLAKTELDIEETQLEIEKINLEIRKTEIDSENLDKKIGKQKEQIASLLRLIYKQEQVTTLEALLLNDSLSDFLNQIKYLQNTNEKLSLSVNELKGEKEKLEENKLSLENKNQEALKLKQKLEEKMDSLQYEQNQKENILIITQESEQEYQALLSRVKAEQNKAQAEINNAESLIRQKMSAKDKDKLESGDSTLTWPVTKNYITSTFHDPDYPYRKIIGEHSAIDIRAAQGSSLYAAADGYVAKVSFDGSKNYGYIMIIHGNNLATVYGHVSAVHVKVDQYVVKGQIIGKSGGTPGTPGSGSFSTGPHLHFEVRKNGIPVNPLNYLP
ncbi:MAG: peptidoglycan DD-metalloendopeptidase family protein [Patescibacteria group bacterium]|jgi:murein DD-endopeptidase MepM/ murein hydrolase activator NlpD|nr:peptidoglycan DD-metalloendopeptidase family protein [Patescibacteria group bacterium]MDD3778396.1 peptidoglycan DD-metalloendopeptidase family protein [Patescibacteria group bacterium]MDD4443773.1 peptidoglycan DD-metalloendopeptidase family protein [Patescibacteria group bacterium]